MEFLAPVSLSVGVFSIVLALVAIWLSVTYSRDAAKALSETRELMRGLIRELRRLRNILGTRWIKC